MASPVRPTRLGTRPYLTGVGATKSIPSAVVLDRYFFGPSGGHTGTASVTLGNAACSAAGNSTIVHYIQSAGGAGSGGTMTMTLTNAPKQGNLLLAAGASPNGIATNTAAGWQQIATATFGSFHYAWAFKYAGAGELTAQSPFTYTLTCVGELWEFSGVAHVFDNADGTWGTAGAAASPPSASRTTPPQYVGDTAAVFGAVLETTSGTATLSDGVIDQELQASRSFVAGHKSGLPTTNPWTETITWGGGASSVSGIAVMLISGVDRATAAVSLDNATVSSTGTVKTHGTESTTLGSVTVSAAGKVLDPGSSTVALGNATLSSSGSVLDRGALSKTLGNVTISATGHVGTVVHGSLDVTLANATESAAGTVVDHGHLAVTLGATVSSSGHVSDPASASVILGAASVVANGSVLDRGALSVTLGNVTIAATADDVDHGVESTTLQGVTCSASGVVAQGHRFASLSAILDDCMIGQLFVPLIVTTQQYVATEETTQLYFAGAIETELAFP